MYIQGYVAFYFVVTIVSIGRENSNCHLSVQSKEAIFLFEVRSGTHLVKECLILGLLKRQDTSHPILTFSPPSNFNVFIFHEVVALHREICHGTISVSTVPNSGDILVQSRSAELRSWVPHTGFRGVQRVSSSDHYLNLAHLGLMPSWYRPNPGLTPKLQHTQ